MQPKSRSQQAQWRVGHLRLHSIHVIHQLSRLPLCAARGMKTVVHGIACARSGGVFSLGFSYHLSGEIAASAVALMPSALTALRSAAMLCDGELARILTALAAQLAKRPVSSEVRPQWAAGWAVHGIGYTSHKE